MVGFPRSSLGNRQPPEAGRSDEERAVEHLQRLLERGVARGEITAVDAGAMARVLIGVFMEATLHILSGSDANATIEIVDRMLDSVGAPNP